MPRMPKYLKREWAFFLESVAGRNITALQEM